jgi:cellulose synthase operon protein C
VSRASRSLPVVAHTWPVTGLALVATLIAALPSEAARRSREPTLATLAARPAPVDPGQPVEADAALAAASYQRFLEIPGADPALRARALRRLGDLRLAEAEAQRAADGTVEGPADGPAADAARAAIAAYEQLLAEQPDTADADAALYQLARAQEGLGQPDLAMARLDELVSAHPSSPHYAEAQFRRGETLFAAQRYADAEAAYAAVLGQADPEFGQQARYKLAWSQFKQ